MADPKRPFADAEAAPVEGLGLLVAALGLIDEGQPPYDRRKFHVSLARALTGESDRLPGNRNGLCKLTLVAKPNDLIQETGEVIRFLSVGGSCQRDPAQQPRHSNRCEAPRTSRHAPTLHNSFNQRGRQWTEGVMKARSLSPRCRRGGPRATADYHQLAALR